MFRRCLLGHEQGIPFVSCMCQRTATFPMCLRIYTIILTPSFRLLAGNVFTASFSDNYEADYQDNTSRHTVAQHCCYWKCSMDFLRYSPIETSRLCNMIPRVKQTCAILLLILIIIDKLIIIIIIVLQAY